MAGAVGTTGVAGTTGTSGVAGTSGTGGAGIAGAGGVGTAGAGGSGNGGAGGARTGSCGDGVIEFPEECDPPNGITCDQNCQAIPLCGNGRLDPGEICDPAAAVDFPTCESTCQSVPDSTAAANDMCAAASPGALWSLTSASGIIRGIAAVTPANVWRYGDSAVDHWDGTSWTTAVLSGQTFTSIWASGANDVWVGGDAPLQHWDGGTWTTIALDEVGIVDHIWGTGPQDVWVAGRGLTSSVVHWDGSAWADRTPVAVSSGQLSQIDALGGTGPADVWLLGLLVPDPTAPSIYFGSVLHWEGTGWEPLVTLPAAGATTSFPVTLWAAAANDVWVAGSTQIGGGNAQEAMWHFDGTGWIARPEFFAFGTIAALWGSCANRVWAVGQDSLGPSIWFFDGSRWTALQGNLNAAFGSISGTSANDVWFGGGGLEMNTETQFGDMLHRRQ